MKKFITAIALVAGTTFSFGQECNTQTEPNYNGDEAGCRQAISLYTEFLKQENFNDAIGEWWPAQKICPQYKPVLYDNGTYLYKQAAKAITDKNSAEFKGKMDTLNTIYGLWIENFGDCYEIQMQLGHDNMMDENKRYNVAYKSYENAFKTIPEEKIQSYDVVYYFRSTYFMLSGKLIDCEVMMNLYEKLNGIADRKIKANQDAGNTGEVQNWLTAQQTMESYIAPCANCEQLLKIYKPQWEDDKTNLELAKKISDKLGKLDCKDPIMMELAVFIDSQEPSYKSKMALGNAFWAKGETSKAKEYYEAAMAFPECTEDSKKTIYKRFGEYDYGKGKYKSAFKYGSMIGGCDGKYLQAKSVAGSANDCATNRTQRTAVYSYALDLAEAAGSCVSSSWVSNLKGQLSTKADLFSEGIKPGDSIDVPCWGKSVKIRVQ
jgi:tetratricopeptide (TPR) repeat protein